ncbi:sensor histidine kinase [Lacinutrix undariae]
MKLNLITLLSLNIKASSQSERYLLVYMLALLLIFCTLIILFFIVFQKRKNKLLLDKIKQQQIFDEEISRTQTEIQEETLKHIGWELHDNVGQLLAYASMQINMLSVKAPEELKATVKGTSDVIKESLQEVRALSKSLNNDVLLNMGLEQSLQNELTRLKRMKFVTADLSVEGERRELTDKKHEIIIFRILQEFFSNSVKYSEAENLKIILKYQPQQLIIEAVDDGIGFDVETAEKGSGLINMKSRAELIKAEFNLQSQPQKGVVLQLTYPFN